MKVNYLDHQQRLKREGRRLVTPVKPHVELSKLHHETLQRRRRVLNSIALSRR